MSVELALAAHGAGWYAVECDQGCALIRKNWKKFRTPYLDLVEGRAPAALADLPAPDAVFIGGPGGHGAIVDTVLARNPNARICVSAIALESWAAPWPHYGQRPGREVSRSPLAGPGLWADSTSDGQEPHLPYHRRTK